MLGVGRGSNCHVGRIGCTYVLGAAESNTGDARDELQAELANGLAGLLLTTGVDSDGGTGGNVGLIASLGARVRVALDVLDDVVIVDFFNAGVSHFCGSEVPKGQKKRWISWLVRNAVRA